MAKKIKTAWTNDDWQHFLEYNIQQQNIGEFQLRLSEMNGRELYEMDTWSLYNRYLIDRPVNYAFHRTVINYPVAPVDVMRDCLIDGQVILRVDDFQHIQVEEYITRAEWNTEDYLIFLETKYIYTETNKEDYFHVEHYHRNDNGTAEWIVFQPVRPNQPEDEWKIASQVTLPVFNFVGIKWIHNQSFLEHLKSSVIRLEAAYRVIGAENIERMGLSLYIEGVRSIEDIQTAPRKMGRRVHILPKDAQFHSPSSDAPGMELMIEELNRLETAIEKASGVVSTEKLASLSGVSRQIAEKPLIILADELRNRFSKGMTKVEELAKSLGGAEDLSISYKSLEERIPRSLKEQIDLLDISLAKGIITDKEYSGEIRILLDFAPE